MANKKPHEFIPGASQGSCTRINQPRASSHRQVSELFSDELLEG